MENVSRNKEKERETEKPQWKDIVNVSNSACIPTTAHVVAEVPKMIKTMANARSASSSNNRVRGTQRSLRYYNYAESDFETACTSLL